MPTSHGPLECGHAQQRRPVPKRVRRPTHGKRIRTLRKRQGWTQVYMAEHVGMDRSFISDLENGKKEICLRNLELLGTTFGMTISQLTSRL